jgi:hypothetical protein
MKLCARKVARVPIVWVPAMGISGLSLGSPGTKSHLNVAPMESYRVYYRGEGGGFPQIWAVVSLVNPSCLWFVLAPKVLQLCINHFVLVFCRFVWISEACQFFLVPSQSSSTPLYPSKCCKLGSGPNSLFFCYFKFRTHIWVLQGIGSVSMEKVITKKREEKKKLKLMHM